MSDEPFDGDKFREVWRSLPDKTKDKIRDKASWEHMSLPAVMRDYYPRLWRKVKNV